MRKTRLRRLDKVALGFAFTAAVDELDEVTGSRSAERLEDGMLEIEFAYPATRPSSKPNV